MKRNTIAMTMRRLGVVASAALTLTATPALAVDYYLCAQQFTKPMPDGSNITMWGFAEDDDSNLANGCGVGLPSVPGPRLVVPPGDNRLIVHLLNDGLPEPVSVVIPGQPATMDPVYFVDGQGRRRVRSFSKQTASGVERAYVFGSVAQPLKAGSYVYHSGSHPQVQVQMGLYGGVTKDAAPGQVYPGVGYDSESILFYSEIDPALHAAVAGGTYGTPPLTSTVDYLPTYFLVNGEPHTAATPPISAGSAGGRNLIRFFNMGLLSHAPMLQSGHLSLLAENGSPYPYPKEVYSQLLPASSTLDAIFTPTAAGDYPIYDRMLNLANAANTTGGLLSILSVGAASATDTVTVLRTRYVGGSSELRVWANSTATPGAILTLPAYGVAMDSFPANFDYNYREYVPGIATNPGTVTVVSNQGGTDTKPVPYTADPVAVNDAYAVDEGGSLVVAATGLLANDRWGGWFDGGIILLAEVVDLPANGGLTLNADGGFSYAHNGGEAASDSFTYRVKAVNSATLEVRATSSPAQVQIAVNAANDVPTLVIPLTNGTAREGTLYSRNIAASFSDPEGQTLTYSLTGLPAGTGLAIDGATGIISGTLTAADLAASPLTLVVRASDPLAAFVQDNFRLTVRPKVNTAPVSVNDYALTQVNNFIFVDILANDTDEGLPVLPADVTVTMQGASLRNANGAVVRELGTDGVSYPVKITKKGGQAVYRGNGTVRYTPPLTFKGSDLFKYTITDKAPVNPLTSSPASVRVDVVQ